MKRHFAPALVLVIAALLSSCSDNNQNTETSGIKLISRKQLGIEEPSGITFTADYSGYWIIDGKKGRIIKTTASGEPLETLIYKGEDIEGIYFDSTDSTLWIAEERSRHLVQLTLSGNVLKIIPVQIEGVENKGLEGMTRDSEGNFWVVNENSPAAVLKVDPNGAILQQYPVDFASDLSDISIIPPGNEFYLLSDESSAFYRWSPSDGMKEKYTLPSVKYEGIVYNPYEKTITVVNDETQLLEIYKH